MVHRIGVHPASVTRLGRVLVCCLAVLSCSLSSGQETLTKQLDVAAESSPVAEATSIMDRYDAPSGLPDFPVSWGTASAAYGPQGGTYYRARGFNWVQADYLLWWLEGQHLPALAATGNGDVLLGGGRFGDGDRNGLRIRGGHFFDCGATCGLMVDFFGLETDGPQQIVSGDLAGGLVLPFTDMDLSLPANQTNGCACVDTVEGTASSVPADSLRVSSSTDLWSGGAYFRGRMHSCYACPQDTCCCRQGLGRCGQRLDGIIGYRYLQFDETLSFAGSLNPSTGPILASDRFEAENDFHGVDFGLMYERERGRWGLEVTGKVALGITRQRLTIDGVGNQAGGLFAQSTNMGMDEHDAVTVIPEINLSLSYSLSCNLRARCGYSFLWLSNVIRPATQLDTRADGRFFDTTQPVPLDAPLAFFPRPDFETESVWLHGLSFGLEYWF